MRALITGGAGFIGSHLARRLVDQGHQVTALDNLSTGSPERLASLPVKLIEGDIRDQDLVDRLADEADAIFHLAAVVGVPHAMAHRWDSLTTNMLGTYHLLTASRRRGGIPLFIASSSAIYGKLLKIPVLEEDDVHLGNTHVASWTYSYAKLAEEQLALAAWHEWSAPVKIGRYFNVIGPGQTGAYGMVVPRFVERALRSQPLPVYGDGTQTRTFADVEDVVDATMVIWERGQWGSVYNIGGNHEISILKLAMTVKRVAHSESEIQLIPYEQAMGPGFEEPVRRKPSTAKVEALGFVPRFSLQDTITRVVSSVRTAAESEPTP